VLLGNQADIDASNDTEIFLSGGMAPIQEDE
jgi:hypothetical protein